LENKISKVLVVCAHPDDETLGLGGTLALHVKNSAKVFVLIFADGESSRSNSTPKKLKQRQKQAEKACSILGIKNVRFLNYPDQKLDTFPLLELAKHIEAVIKKFRPDTIYTHYWGDVNQDHQKLFEATLIATRPLPTSSIKRVICFETPSSTEWGHAEKKFNPNLFVDINSVLNKKMKAVQQYKNEILSFPHPRSKDAIVNRAHHWGSSVGLKHAEAFMILRQIVKK